MKLSLPGGIHHFENFEKEDNARILELRDAFRNSDNLVFIRLMRDLVSYHRARLQYNYETVLADPTNPVRIKCFRKSPKKNPARFCAGPIRRMHANGRADRCPIVGDEE